MRIRSGKLLFDEDAVRSVTPPGLPRLIRVIFFGFGITNEEYLDRFKQYYKETNEGDLTDKEQQQRIGQYRKFLLDPRKITIFMFQNILRGMGFDVECISMRLRNRLTGEVRTFSTDDTVDDLKEQIKETQRIGIGSLI